MELLGPRRWRCGAFLPNILAHGQLVTPDIGATAMGLAAGYFFWHWLTEPGWSHAGIAGLAMGLAELTRTNWIILFALWPVAWLIWMWAPLRQGTWTVRVAGLAQLSLVLLLGVYVLNVGYLFDGSFRPLGEYELRALP